MVERGTVSNSSQHCLFLFVSCFQEKEKYRRDEEKFLLEFATSSYCRRDSAKGIKSKVKVDDKFSRFEDEIEREEMERRRRERKVNGKGVGKISGKEIGER